MLILLGGECRSVEWLVATDSVCLIEILNKIKCIFQRTGHLLSSNWKFPRKKLIGLWLWSSESFVGSGVPNSVGDESHVAANSVFITQHSLPHWTLLLPKPAAKHLRPEYGGGAKWLAKTGCQFPRQQPLCLRPYLDAGFASYWTLRSMMFLRMHSYLPHE